MEVTEAEGKANQKQRTEGLHKTITVLTEVLFCSCLHTDSFEASELSGECK